jgi:hypothetical protein
VGVTGCHHHAPPRRRRKGGEISRISPQRSAANEGSRQLAISHVFAFFRDFYV